MDTIDRSNSNLPAQFSVPSFSLPALSPVVTTDQIATPGLQISPSVLLRGLTRHWWRILLLCLVVSAPVVALIFWVIRPTYEAVSLLQIEPAMPELFGPFRGGSGDSRSETYLQTQVSLILSAHVLEPAVADPLVVNLSTGWIKKSEDPKIDLRKKLTVEIQEATNLIRVALELEDPDEAVTIVNAVVGSYMRYHSEYSRHTNKDLTDSLTKQLDKLRADIESKRLLLKDLLKKNNVTVLKQPNDMLNSKSSTDSTQPTFTSLSEDHIHRMMAEMVQTELQLIEAQAMFDVRTANQEKSERELPEVDEQQLQARIRDEFKKDPEVVALKQEIAETIQQLEHVKQNARLTNDPSRVAAQKQYDQLKKAHNELWEQKYQEIRERLSIADGAIQSPESLSDLKLKVDELKRKKERQAELFKVMQVERKETNNDTFEATYLDYQVQRLQNREDQVEKNLEQLKFEASQDKYRVELVDTASAPKSPSNNRRLKYMAAAPVGVLFMMLGLFLLLEARAERVADPDALSTRVRSEVYALPPLPTARAIRKLSVSQADLQIEHFIQRLDHLRFALCGNPAELGKGRCVLITSAVGGEGKTTLAAQLASRCGSTGMSILLVDCDLRRASLCALFDVPEGPGLSDVLNDMATVDDVVIPVQGGAFDLLPAGKPIQDTYRLLQGPKIGQLLGQLRQPYDLIIIDSPPVLPVPDALILGRWADGAVIAARYDISRFPQVERARRQLSNAGVAILGTVINGVRHSDSYYGRYTYRKRQPSQPDSSNTN